MDKRKRATKGKATYPTIGLSSFQASLPVGTWPSIPFEGLIFNLFITTRFSDLSLRFVEIKSLNHNNKSDVTFFCFSLFDLER